MSLIIAIINIRDKRVFMSLVGRKIEITHANFGDMVREHCLLVDKTLMIKDFLAGKKVSLILRPRRFGKTLTMSMLQHFFCKEIAGEATSELFNDFAIAQLDKGKFLQQHQGQYPVISITFKDLKEPSFEATVNQLRNLIQEVYREHETLINSNKSAANKAMFQQYLDGSADDEQLQAALKFLSEFLYKTHNKKKVIILIDEYDSPLTAAYTYGYLESLSNFMRNFLSSALKDNQYLEKGLMTGILRVSKNQMLSELNNLEVYTLLNETYNQYFGFTESEVTELIQMTGASSSLEEMRPFYNGYLMGSRVIYNPWSVMNYLDKKKLAYYWVLTSNDTLLKKILLNSSDETKEKLSRLMQGETIEGKVDVNLRYEDLMDKKEALWTLLLFAGYLTVVNQEPDDLQFRCQLNIPNQEVLAQYTSIFKRYLEESLGEMKYDSFLKSLLVGDVKQFTARLSHYLLDSFSVKDTPAMFDAENIYHALMLGLVASVHVTHQVDSNKESGTGFYDLMLFPINPSYAIGIIFELKYMNITSTKEPTKIHALLATEAEKGLKQIEDRRYETVLKRSPYVKQILKIGLAFSGKNVVSVYQIKDVKTNTDSEQVVSQFEKEEKNKEY